MEPHKEVEARLPMPFPLGTSVVCISMKYSNNLIQNFSEYTEEFAGKDYNSRNLRSKKSNIKVVVTEEALDDWQAILENQRIGKKSLKLGTEEAAKDKQRQLILKRQQQVASNFNLTKGYTQVTKQKEDLFPRFYWSHQDAQSFVINQDENQNLKTELDINVSYDFKRRKNSRTNQVIKQYSQQQRDLIRDIGGIPGKVLANIKSNEARRSIANNHTQPFKLPKQSNSFLPQKDSPSKMYNSLTYADMKKTDTIDTTQTQETNRSFKRNNRRLVSANQQNRARNMMSNQGLNLNLQNSMKKQDFWVTQQAGNKTFDNTQTQNNLNTTTLTLSERNYYDTYNKRDASESTKQQFEGTKKQVIEEFLNIKEINKDIKQTYNGSDTIQSNQSQTRSFRKNNNIQHFSHQVQLTKSSQRVNNNISKIDIKLERNILNELIIDDEIDKKTPVVNNEVDRRKIKIEKSPIEIKPTQQLRNKRLDFQNPDFWFMKGFDHFKEMHLESAIDSYRYAIRKQRFQQAIKWYKYCLEVDSYRYEAYLGLALCYLKEGNSEEALKNTEQGIKILKELQLQATSENKKELEDHLAFVKYLQAISLKHLRRYTESEKMYNLLLKFFNREEGNKIAKYIFGMILMPIEINRKKIMEYVEGFEGIMEQYESDQIDRRKLMNYYLDPSDKTHKYIYDNQDPKWIDKHRATVLKAIRQLSFFSRFQIKRQREIMDKMSLRLCTKNQLLFFEKNEVYVIVSGSILMKNHERNVMLPQTYAKFSEGDILNFHQDNSEIFNSVETWFYCQVDTEIAIFELDYFEQIWKDLLQNDKLVLKQVLSCHQMFNKLNDLTLMTMVFEYFETKKFNYGEIILTQSKQAPTNTGYSGYYDSSKISKLGQSIKKRKKGMNNHNDSSSILAANQSQMKTISVLEEDQQLFSKQKTNIQFNKDRTENIFSLIEKGKDKIKTNIHVNETQSIEPKRSSRIEAIQASQKKQIPLQSIEREADGIYIVDEGQCAIVNKSDNFESKTLRRWDFFGECDLLKVIGVTCFFISNENFKKIPVYEQHVMKMYCQSREDISMIAYLYSNRYGVDIKQYANYY
eukprot:403353470